MALLNELYVIWLIRHARKIISSTQKNPSRNKKHLHLSRLELWLGSPEFKSAEKVLSENEESSILYNHYGNALLTLGKDFFDAIEKQPELSRAQYHEVAQVLHDIHEMCGSAFATSTATLFSPKFTQSFTELERAFSIDQITSRLPGWMHYDVLKNRFVKRI